MNNIVRILGLYLGRNVKHSNDGDISVLIGIEQESCSIWSLDSGRHVVHPESFKLLLRSLADITEDENNICNSLVSGCPMNENPNPMFWSPEQFIYLLGRGFDLFNLIESEIAIDEKKIDYKY